MSPGNALAALWLFWGVVWLSLALWVDRTVQSQTIGERVEHALPTALGCYLLAGKPPLAALAATVVPRAPARLWALVALTALGIGWTFWARAHLGRLWSGIVTLKEGHRIVRSGPYGITRHPIYTGLLLAIAATAAARGTLAALLGAAIIVAAFRFKLGQEETMLLAHFGDAYRAYQREVPALLPFSLKK